ncbi:MAG TPA: PKD domain-containing protein [Solirubrobacteraceae bacterium]|nr:PKD domain-containing protein [Solirubrobacteraceae bacterium]
MTKTKIIRLLAVGGAVLGAAFSTASSAAGAGRSAIGYAKVRRVCPAPAPGHASCFALVRAPATAAKAATPGVAPYRLNDGASTSGPAGGLTPAQLSSAYGYDPTAGGAGQTVAVVDAYEDPAIESDLGAFDTQYGLSPCTEANGCFEKVGQTGSRAVLPTPDSTGWSVEIALDVETVRAACRQCKILLVEANDPSYRNLATAVNEAASLGASEVSNSYGGPEGEIGVSEQGAYNHPGVVVAAATGDLGYDDWTVIEELEDEKRVKPPEQPNAPASLPSVVAVGGTTLTLTEGGARESESVWNGNGPGDSSFYVEGASGGGCSTLFAAKPWQHDVAGFPATGCGTKRLDADIAAVADPLTGFDIYDSYACGSYCTESGLGKGWVTIGGTSLATPLISSLYALAGGGEHVEYPSLTLYGHLGSSSLFDVTEGANGFCGGETVSECGDPNASFGHVDCEGTTACNAAVGFDGPSGVGAPKGLGAFQPRPPTAAITPPSSPKAGAPASFSGAGSSDPYPGGSIVSYSWSWGDGTPGSGGVSPAHTFAAPGQYTVTLTVTDNYGLGSASSSQVVQASERSRQEIEEEEAAVKKRAEEEAAAKKHAEEEAAARKHAEEEAAAKKHAEEEAAARKHTEEEATKVAVGTAAQGTAAFQVAFTPAAPDARLVGTTLSVSPTGAMTLRISCPAGVITCSGTVRLQTLAAIPIFSGARAKRLLTLAATSFNMPEGSTRTLTLHLSTRVRGLLAGAGTLRAKALVLARDPAGATHSSQQLVTLRAPSRRRG